MDVQWHPWVPWDAGFFFVIRPNCPSCLCAESYTSKHMFYVRHFNQAKTLRAMPVPALPECTHMELEANCSTVLQLNGLPNKQNRSTSITVVKHTSSSRRTVITMTRKSRYLFCPSIDQMHYLSSAYFKRIQNNCFDQGIHSQRINVKFYSYHFLVFVQ